MKWIFCVSLAVMALGEVPPYVPPYVPDDMLTREDIVPTWNEAMEAAAPTFFNFGVVIEGDRVTLDPKKSSPMAEVNVPVYVDSGDFHTEIATVSTCSFLHAKAEEVMITATQRNFLIVTSEAMDLRKYMFSPKLITVALQLFQPLAVDVLGGIWKAVSEKGSDLHWKFKQYRWAAEQAKEYLRCWTLATSDSVSQCRVTAFVRAECRNRNETWDETCISVVMWRAWLWIARLLGGSKIGTPIPWWNLWSSPTVDLMSTAILPGFCQLDSWDETCMEETPSLPVAGSNSALDFVLMPITEQLRLTKELGRTWNHGFLIGFEMLLDIFKSTFGGLSSVLSRDFELASWFYEISKYCAMAMRAIPTQSSASVDPRGVEHEMRRLFRAIRERKTVPDIYACLQASARVNGSWAPSCLDQFLKEARDSKWGSIQLPLLQAKTHAFAEALSAGERRMRARVQNHRGKAKEVLGFKKSFTSLTATEKKLVNEKVFQYATADIESETCSREAEDHCLFDARWDRYDDDSAEACKKKFKENTRDRALTLLEGKECPSTKLETPGPGFWWGLTWYRVW